MRISVRGRLVWRAVAAGFAALSILGAFAPFDFDIDLPAYREDGLERLPDGTLRFAAPAVTRTAGAPAWLDAAIEDSALAVQLGRVPRRGLEIVRLPSGSH